MSQNIQVVYSLFGGNVVGMNVQFGLNATPTSMSADIIAPKGVTLNIKTRDFVSVQIGAFSFKGIVQSWEKSIVDLGGTGVYQVKLADPRIVLEAAQVIVGSPNYDYGSNIIAIPPTNSDQILEGVNFSTIKSKVILSTLKYGSIFYTVKFDFTLTARGPNSEYSIENSIFSLSDLISRIADDHGLDWYITTTEVNATNKRISVKFFDRTKDLSKISFNVLKGLHVGEIIKYHEGKENRDSVIKSVLIGGYKTYLHESLGTLWTQFWGFGTNDSPTPDKCTLIFDNSNEIPDTTPAFTRELMSKIINQKYQEKEFTEEEIQRVTSYANDYWGRKFYSQISPPSALDLNGKSWRVPVSAGWWEGASPPACFDQNGQLKFETEDGRWVTFVQLPLPGIRNDNSVLYQWDDSLYSNPNTHVGPEPNTNVLHGRTLWVKANAEIFGSYFVITLAAPLRVRRVGSEAEKVNLERLMASILARCLVVEAFARRLQGIQSVISQYHGVVTEELEEIKRILFNDAATLEWTETGDQVDVRKVAEIRAIAEDPINSMGDKLVIESRMEQLEKIWLSLLNQKETYGPWSNNIISFGKTEVVIDSSLVPWSFGYHGITNAQGVSDMNDSAKAKIRSIVDTTPEVDTMELQVANVPKINIGTQLNLTCVVTSINISFSLSGITTTYKSNQYGKNQNVIKRKPPGKHKPFQEFQDFAPKSLLEPSIDVPKESRDISTLTSTPSEFMGRIYHAEESAPPRYDCTPMRWVQQFGGELVLEQDSTRLGDFYDVVNMGEKQTAAGRLRNNTDVTIKIFGSKFNPAYFMDVIPPKPDMGFTAIIKENVSSSHPVYRVDPVYPTLQSANLLSSEVNALKTVRNLGEPQNFAGSLSIGTEVTISWNEDDSGVFTPYIQMQLNLFKPPA